MLATVLDARRQGFEVMLVEGSTRPVTPDGGMDARRKMREVGAIPIDENECALPGRGPLAARRA